MSNQAPKPDTTQMYELISCQCCSILLACVFSFGLGTPLLAWWPHSTCHREDDLAVTLFSLTQNEILEERWSKQGVLPPKKRLDSYVTSDLKRKGGTRDGGRPLTRATSLGSWQCSLSQPNPIGQGGRANTFQGERRQQNGATQARVKVVANRTSMVWVGATNR